MNPATPHSVQSLRLISHMLIAAKAIDRQPLHEAEPVLESPWVLVGTGQDLTEEPLPLS